MSIVINHCCFLSDNMILLNNIAAALKSYLSHRLCKFHTKCVLSLLCSVHHRCLQLINLLLWIYRFLKGDSGCNKVMVTL